MDPIRKAKLDVLRTQGITPYADRFDRTHTLLAAKTVAAGSAVRVAGRMLLRRSMGQLTFATLQDHTGRLQIAFRSEVMGAESYEHMATLLDLGDFIGVSGEHFVTKTGEPTILVKEWTLLSKALRQPPEKWHGIADQETAWRQRYLDLFSNRETFDRFLLRGRFIRRLREFYWANGFEEVDLPVLVNDASGALATPFVTHHAALDIPLYLRIALETHQKECLVGGFDRTFCLGPVFRNEGIDPSHLQEFTMVEHYAAYWDFADNMRFTEEMLSTVLTDLLGTTVVQIPDRTGQLIEVDFAPPWPRITLRDAIMRSCGIDIAACKTAEVLRGDMRAKGITLDVNIDVLGHGNLVDQLYKKVSRPGIIHPTFLTQHPVSLSPLARLNDQDPAITDRFQLVVGGWEIVNAYSELVDPVDQAQRFAVQSDAKAGGDHDAHGKDDAYVTALEYGCPPCSGFGMGIDRIITLLTKQANLRDSVLFPMMKPLEREKRETIQS